MKSFTIGRLLKQPQNHIVLDSFGDLLASGFVNRPPSTEGHGRTRGALLILGTADTRMEGP